MPTIKIKGMSCGHCVASVTKALSEVAGISNVSVSLEKGEATFSQEPDVPMSVIKEAIAKIGFEATE